MRSKKPKKTWKTWLLGSLSVLILILVAGGGFLYYKLNSIDVDDIVQRHQLTMNEGDAADSGSSVIKTESKESKLPSILNSTVDKAEEFASKPIKTQDALDAAALLLKSGLSLKEVYYLTGEAKSDLSTKDKQKIRDLLLSKLSASEITALRLITKQYGKGLLILDPNYPIELIGIDDPVERKRVEQELKANKPAIAESKSPEPTNSNQVKVEEPTAENKPPVASIDPAITSSYRGKLDALKVSCQGDINNLITNVINAKKADAALGLKELQSSFMGKFTSAESNCDASFNAIVSEAARAGISDSEIQGWKKEYGTMKQTAQSNAINQIAQAFKK